MSGPTEPGGPDGGVRHVLSPEVRLAVAQARLTRAEAESIIRDHVILGSTLSMAPLPVIDGILLFNLQLNLIGRLADHYGLPFDQVYRGIAASLLTGALPVLAAGLGLSGLKLWPGFGTLGAAGTLSTLAGLVSYATGKVLMEHFEAGGTLEDLTTRAFRVRIRHALREGRPGMQALLAGRPA
ncbi:hypothetical protein [uncultured Thiohalocapsa sp.]|uniref:hypothetical protein n=1 Tax=uncultured Thiohalocapsa sp. TaxID=768990 RepID=UPI0025FA243E|nr:hypothetical protein [uncultured Thiohalocapsa sp.]